VSAAVAGDGLLVVFEGPEGAGKSTQAARLVTHLTDRNIASSLVREPGGTRVGEEIRRLLLDPNSEIVPESECLLFLASRAEVVARVLKPALAAGNVVVLDRFFLSTYAYQIAGRGLAEEQVRSANALATAGVTPRVTLLLTIDPAAGLARASRRGAQDRMELTGSDFHARVSNAFRMFATQQWQREHPECGEIIALDGSLPEEEVFASIMQVLASRWPHRFGVAQ
jgi:dTMP kinase